GAGSLAAPMPAKVTALMVSEGDSVTAGQTLVVLEAMKMEHSLRAPADGQVTAVHYAVGDLVEEGGELLSLETS
ncbi:MAG: biotin/lipoyl-binding protein, partial [Gammaproteobacteria bacterium]|nr:acetyl-CoA carboxylase biotin carboxyl carrier protein subunit [Gammaproteobacteria bacterium]NIV19234.1 biotin/lipoyl-binding protein [Gammaproteobacteria bacterium]NIX10126.1 biotin/lipoyl-binding protein [Gammaproteobacteria bacterium]